MSQQNETLMAAGVVALGLVAAAYISKPEQSKKGDGCTLEKYKKGNDASCQFLNDPAVCFHENSVVELNNGEQKSINEIVKGDILKNGSKVQCVVKTLCFEGKSKFVNVNGLLLFNVIPEKVAKTSMTAGLLPAPSTYISLNPLSVVDHVTVAPDPEAVLN